MNSEFDEAFLASVPQRRETVGLPVFENDEPKIAHADLCENAYRENSDPRCGGI